MAPSGSDPRGAVFGPPNEGPVSGIRVEHRSNFVPPKILQHDRGYASVFSFVVFARIFGGVFAIPKMGPFLRQHPHWYLRFWGVVFGPSGCGPRAAVFGPPNEGPVSGIRVERRSIFVPPEIFQSHRGYAGVFSFLVFARIFGGFFAIPKMGPFLRQHPRWYLRFWGAVFGASGSDPRGAVFGPPNEAPVSGIRAEHRSNFVPPKILQHHRGYASVFSFVVFARIFGGFFAIRKMGPFLRQPPHWYLPVSGV